MSVSDAEHQNQYFVDTGAGGAGPATYLYEYFRKRRKDTTQQDEREKRIVDLKKQIVELKDKLQKKTEIIETIQKSETLLRQEVDRVNTDVKKTQTKQGSQIIKLDAKIENLENSRLQNLCSETTFACELLKMAVESVPQGIVSEDGDFGNLREFIKNTSNNMHRSQQNRSNSYKSTLTTGMEI
jgi:hypothetical protein